MRSLGAAATLALLLGTTACRLGLVPFSTEASRTLRQRVVRLLRHPYLVKSEELEHLSSAIERAVLSRRLTRSEAVRLLAALSRHPLHDQVSLLQLHDTLTTLELGARRLDVWALFRRALMEQSPLQRLRRGARGRRFVVSTNSRYATAAAREVLEEGGNPVDAAIAAFALLWVTDPANASPLGRSQWLIWRPGRPPLAVDATTRIPAVARRFGERFRRVPEGLGTSPLPGNLAALQLLVRRGLTSLPLDRLLRPAWLRARQGFTVRPEQEVMWRRALSELRKLPKTARRFLHRARHPYRAGDVFANAGLADFLERVSVPGRTGADGIEGFYRGPLGAAWVKRVRALGGLWSIADLRAIRARSAPLLRTAVGGFEVLTSGAKECWGHTLVEMLNILEELIRMGVLAPGEGPLTGREVEALLLVGILALDDSPYEVDTLVVKEKALPLRTLISRRWARRRAREVRQLLRTDRAGLRRFLRRARLLTPDDSDEDRDTSAWSISDGKTWVQVTTSVGPWFGSKRSVDGTLLAYSYLLATRTEALRTIGADRTEQTPTMVLRGGRPVLALGAAGSERIVGSIFHVLALKLRLRPSLSLREAVAQPRIFPKKGAIRLHVGFRKQVVNHLRRRGYLLRFTGRGVRNHLGIVHAVGRRPDGALEGVADPTSTGTAAGR